MTVARVFCDASERLPMDMRIICPRDSQWCPAEDVEWALQNKKILK
jgi:hypothetical protein